jgi:hypothetical protein
MMKTKMFIAAVCMTLSFFIVPVTIAATEVTLVGEVNDNYQFYSGGKIYEVADTPDGNDMVTNYISEKVEVIGTVEVIGEDLVLTVQSFKVVAE